MALTPAMVTIDCADPRSLAVFWSEAAGYEVSDDFDGWYVVLRPSAASAGGIDLGLQKVSEPRVGKNRVHLDWRTNDRPGEVSRLVGLGATVLAEHAVPGFGWTVLADPEGNEFCVGSADGPAGGGG